MCVCVCVCVCVCEGGKLGRGSMKANDCSESGNKGKRERKKATLTGGIDDVVTVTRARSAAGSTAGERAKSFRRANEAAANRIQ